MPAWDDLDPFLDPEDFGVWADVSFQAGGTRRVAVLFDDPAAGLRFERRAPKVSTSKLGGYDQDAEDPFMVGKESDLAGIRRRDTVVIAGKSYGVLTGPQPDGNGMARVGLAAD